MKIPFFLCVFAIFGFTVSFASSPYICGTNYIQGKVETPAVQETTVVITITDKNGIQETINPIIDPQGLYSGTFDLDALGDGVYTISSTASYSGSTATTNHETYIGKQCGVCGNQVVENQEQCESTADCSVGLFCNQCACRTHDEMMAIIQQYADEVASFKKNHSTQVVPTRFLNTGPFSFVDSLVKKAGFSFTSSKSKIYNNLPDWTLDPTLDVDSIAFDGIYGSLPEAYRNKDIYLQFKGLFIPVLSSSKNAGEKELLELLNQGAVLAPETPSIDTLGAVKLLYMHSVSTVESPFAGIGSYLSIFSEPGDSLFVYVKKGYKKYEKRSYTIVSKFQVKPEQTDKIKKFEKQGGDSIAVITCKEGTTLGSPKAREIILIDRDRNQMGEFQKTLLALSEDSKLLLAKQKIDKYLENKTLDEKQVIEMVNKLDKVANNGEGNPLKVITTYGKYMASYDALYD